MSAYSIRNIEEWLKERVPIGVTHILSAIWTVLKNYIIFYSVFSSRLMKIIGYSENYNIVKNIIIWLLTIALTVLWTDIFYRQKLKKVKAKTTPKNYEDEAYNIVFDINAIHNLMAILIIVFTAFLSCFSNKLYTAFFIIEWVLVIPLYCFIVNRVINKKISQIYVPKPSVYPEDFSDEQIFRD